MRILARTCFARELRRHRHWLVPWRRSEFRAQSPHEACPPIVTLIGPPARLVPNQIGAIVSRGCAPNNSGHLKEHDLAQKDCGCCGDDTRVCRAAENRGIVCRSTSWRVDSGRAETAVAAAWSRSTIGL